MNSLVQYILTAATANVPLLLCSDPGMGKTALCAEAAKSGGYSFISFSAAVLDPVYLGGVPMRRQSQSDDGSLDFLLAGDFARLTDPNLPPTLLLVDEMNRASAPVMNLLLRLIQERKVGQYDLAAAVRIVATMNPADSGARPISAALANRVIHKKLGSSDLLDGWIKWMRTQSPAHLLISTFLERLPDRAYSFPKGAAQEGPWPSFRSWDNVGRLLDSALQQHISDENKRTGNARVATVADIRPMLCSPTGDILADLAGGLVGHGPLTELFTFLRNADIPRPHASLTGAAPFSQDLSVLTAQMYSVAAMLRSDRGFVIPQFWEHLESFLTRLIPAPGNTTAPEMGAAMAGMFCQELFAARTDAAGARTSNYPTGYKIPPVVAKAIAGQIYNR
jgi:hypothetical protein